MSLRRAHVLALTTALALGGCGAGADSATAGSDVAAPSDSAGTGQDGATTAPDADEPTEDTQEGVEDASGPTGEVDEPAEDGGTTPVPEPTEFVDRAAPYFAPDRVLQVAIELAPEDWEALRLETRTLADILGGDCLDAPPEQLFSWFPATVTVDGVTLTEAGIRKKGYLGSMSYDKPSLKVRFDKYVDQILEGSQLVEGTVVEALERLTLNNVQQDNSKLNTCMSYHVYAAAGAPTPRCGFAAVTVNGQDMGLYVHVESIKKDFIARNFDDPEGNLYEGTLSDFRPVWKNTFDKKNNASMADWSDIDAVTAALQDPSPAGLDALLELVDLDRFLTHWALEALVAHWDGYSGNRNNFYIYREPSKPFVFIPWGPDSSFSPINHPFVDIPDPQSVMAHSAITQRLYKDDTMREAYAARVKELLDTVWDEEALVAEVDRMAAIVQSHTWGQERNWANWDTQRVRDFINQRRAAVLADLEPTPASWPWGQSEPNICWEILGAVDITFETTWGTLNADNFMDIGSAQIATYTVGGESLSFMDSGVTAGLEEDSAVISIIHLDAFGGFDVLNAYVPLNQVTPGDVVFQGWNAPGLRLLFSPPNYEPQWVARLDSGGVQFDTASVMPGGAISGRLHGILYGFEPYASGSGSSGEVKADVGIVLNEIAAKGEPLDWFELHNTSSAAVDLSGFLVADDLTDVAKRVPIPDGTLIEPGAYLQVFMDKEAWPGFALGGNEELGLWTVNGALVDKANWSSGFSGDIGTYARIPDAIGNFQPGQLPTPGAAND